MRQEVRSERSRGALLDAALALFSRQGYRATSVRDIAGQAGTSTGSVYHHFRDKETIFQTLLDQFWAASSRPDFPLSRVFEEGAFPDDLPAIGLAAQETIATWRPYIALIYVDVVEFEGRHIHRFYADLAQRYQEFLERRTDLGIPSRVRESIPPAVAMVLTTRIFVYYFVVEVLFGVPNHYGLSRDDATRLISDILTRGILRQR
ncbi:MAG: helix-turn-helix transcriptional regulator [Acidobacteria bacterium]|nr:helix-turn-helix transcriptional regulator [Acidobacteriota bacterium]